MNSSTKIWLAGLCLACAPAFASISFVGTPAGLGSNDSTNWAQEGPDATTLDGPFDATSVLLIGVTGNFGTDNTGLVADVCPDVPSCSWTTSGTGMNAGDTDLWAFDSAADGGNGGGTGPLTLSFATALLGGGAWIQGDTTGAYTASIQAFGASGSLGAASTLTSDGSGDPVFLGLLDSSAVITSLVFNLTACAGCGDPSLPDFAIDTLLMTDSIVVGTTPEPSSLLLLGSGMVGMAWMLRKRALKNGRRS